MGNHSRNALAGFRGRQSGARSGQRGGFTLIEIMISLSVLVVGLLGFVRVIAMSASMSSANRESDFAIEAARAKIEEVEAANFRDLFALYNAVGGDDPGGAGTAPGNSFTVAGLQPDPADPDGIVGEVVLPAMVGLGGNWEVREDFQSTALGTPRDLSGDGVIDQADHTADYGVLPVLVRLRWRGVRGVSRLEFKVLVAPL